MARVFEHIAGRELSWNVAGKLDCQLFIGGSVIDIALVGQRFAEEHKKLSAIRTITRSGTVMLWMFSPLFALTPNHPDESVVIRKRCI